MNASRVTLWAALMVTTSACQISIQGQDPNAPTNTQPAPQNSGTSTTTTTTTPAQTNSEPVNQSALAAHQAGQVSNAGAGTTPSNNYGVNPNGASAGPSTSGAGNPGPTGPAVTGSANGNAPNNVPVTPLPTTGMNFATIFGNPVPVAGAWYGDVYFPDVATTKLVGASLTKPVVRLFTSSLNVAPQPFSGFSNFGGRKNNFVIVYQGNVEVTNEADYDVRVVSADGAKVSFDGMLIVDNDGEHEPSSKTQPVHLVKATHQIKIEYFHNKSKQVALQVYIRPRGAKTEYLLTSGAWQPLPLAK